MRFRIRALSLAPLALALCAAQARADNVVADDQIVQGSLCVGEECVDNESFGFDTVRLKDTVLRLNFFDTSVGAFPTTDWRMVANDADNEGNANYFAIDNVDTGARIFRIDAGAPSASLFVDGQGNVGFGTSTPAIDLHLLTSNTPALRLQQDASGGLAPQAWDVAGNEANFFIRDVTGGSRLPFRIIPGALTDSLTVSEDGVGVGLRAAEAPLHVRRNDGTTQLRIEELSGVSQARTLLHLVNNGPATIELEDSAAATSWNLTGDAAFTLARTGAATPQFALAANGDLAITGTLSQGSSRTLKTAIAAVDAPAILARVAALPVFEWSYVGRPDRHVGPMAEDFHAAFGLGADPARLAPSDVAGVALVAVQELAEQVEQRKRDIAAIRARIEALEARQP